MGRPANLTVQTPGANAPAQSAQPVGIDIEPDSSDDPEEIGQTDDQAAASADKDAQIAALQAQLAEMQAQAKLPQVVYEPITPHGAQALAQSQFAGMTVAQLMAGIDAGKYREPPVTSVLCSDGWYARRGNAI